MSQMVVFCENYTAIETALYLATRNDNDYPVTIVIPGNASLLKFFQVINERVFHNTLDLIYFEPYRARRVTAKGIKKVFHVLPDIIRERRHLKQIFDEHFAGLTGGEIFFFSRGFSGVRFYLLKRLAKRNRLVYISHVPPAVTPVRRYTPANVGDLVRLIIVKLIYGWGIAMGKLPFVKGFLYIPDRFMQKYVARVIDWVEKSEMMNGFDLSPFKVFDAGDYDVIYFSHSMGPDMVPDQDTLDRELAAIFNILRRYFNEDRIACKHHPQHNGSQIVNKIGVVLEDFIPAEFLYSEKVKVYLSPWSWSIANVEKGLAVSLIDLVSFKSDKLREQVREQLRQASHSEILFPKSLDEFERILAGVKQDTT